MCPRRARSCDGGCSGLAGSFDRLIVELCCDKAVPNHDANGYERLYRPEAPRASGALNK
jgi:hypothetical protein